MKKAVLFIVMLLTAFSLLAEFVPMEKAKRVAENYYVNFCPETASKGSSIVNVHENLYKGIVTRYTFEFDKGFVIVTADDDLYPILGYSDHGKVPLADQDGGQNFKEWFENYDRQISCKGAVKYVDEKAVQLWKDIESNIFSDEKSGIIIDRLLKTEWGQQYPWNELCPEKDSTRTYAGCVATAMAQIMRYHRWPDTGIGSASYEWNDQTLSADFTTHIWNYDLMPEMLNIEYGVYPEYWEAGITQAEKNELALLSYWTGLSVGMNYGTLEDNGSWAYAAPVDDAFLDHWKASSSVYYSMDTPPGGVDAQYATIKAELDAKRPWFWAGGLHAFILDGYRDDYWYHFNWGWEGNYDGWFHRSALIPGGLGSCDTGGGDFTEGQLGITYVPSFDPFSAWPATTISGSVSNGSDINLSWTAQAGATGYRIYRTSKYDSLNDSIYELLTTTTSLSYTDNDLPASAYAYFVVVEYASGESRNSNTYTALIESLPQYPNATDLKAVTTGRTSIDLSWIAPYDGILNFYEGFEGSLNLPEGWIYKACEVDIGWIQTQTEYGMVANISEVTNWLDDYTKMVNFGVNNFFLNSSQMPDGNPAPVAPEVLMWGWLLSPKSVMEATSTVKYWGRFRILNADGTLPAEPASGWPAYDVVSYMGSFTETGTTRINHRIHQSFIINSIAANNVWDRQEVVNLTSAAGEYTRVGFKIKENVYSMCFDDIIIGRDNPNDCEGYEVFRNGSLATEIENGTTYSWSDSLFENGENEYYIKALYATGKSIPSERIIATIDKNPKPDFLTAIYNQSDFNVNLDWYAPYHQPPKWYSYVMPENSTATVDVFNDEPILKRRTIFEAEDLGFYYPVTLDSVAIGFYDWNESNWNGNNTFTIRILTGGTEACDDTIYTSNTLIATHNKIYTHAITTPIVLNEPWNVEVTTDSTGYPGTLSALTLGEDPHSFFFLGNEHTPSYNYAFNDGNDWYEWIHMSFVTSSPPQPIPKTDKVLNDSELSQIGVIAENLRSIKLDVGSSKQLDYYKIYRDEEYVGSSMINSYNDLISGGLIGNLTYKVTALYANPAGESEPSNEVLVIGSGIESDNNYPLSSELFQNYPNPFNPSTSIKYSLSTDAQVKLTVFDITGREVTSLVDQKQNKGWHEAKFDGSMLTSGMYFYRLSVDNKVVASKKMMLLK